MLTDSQILHLLHRCENAAGCILHQIRGNLQTDDWASAAWELIVARISYEPETPGGARPDLRFELRTGEQVLLEMAFAFQGNRSITQAEAHPVFKVLRKKARQARRADSPYPFVVIMATDRVFAINHLRPSRTNRPIHAVYSLFEQSQSLSAVVLVPILLGTEVFTGFVRKARPSILLNPAARHRLSTTARSAIEQFDFNRWEYALWTQQRAVRLTLRWHLKTSNGSAIDVASLEAKGLPALDPFAGVSCWTFSWRFFQLRIVYIGSCYWLFNRRRPIGRFTTPEKAARTASELYQPFPAQLIGPDGIIPHPDQGVPSELESWKIEN